MHNDTNGFLPKLINNPKRVFVMDALGAWLSMILLYGVLVPFESFFGMPRKALYVLSGIAFCLFIYSTACNRLIKSNWKPYLRLLIICNVLYTVLSIGYLIKHANHLTTFGWLYFIPELVLVGIVVWIEYKTYVALDHNS